MKFPRNSPMLEWFLRTLRVFLTPPMLQSGPTGWPFMAKTGYVRIESANFTSWSRRFSSNGSKASVNRGPLRFPAFLGRKFWNPWIFLRVFYSMASFQGVGRHPAVWFFVSLPHGCHPTRFFVNEHRSRIGLVMERMAQILPSLKMKVWCKQPWRTQKTGEGDIKNICILSMYLYIYFFFYIYIYIYIHFLFYFSIYVYIYIYVHILISIWCIPAMDGTWTKEFHVDVFLALNASRVFCFAARKSAIVLMVQKSV